jgi:hypothetical protein
MSEKSLEGRIQQQRHRVADLISRCRGRLDELETLLEAPNTPENWAQTFIIRNKLNELYSELTVYLYLRREERGAGEE